MSTMIDTTRIRTEFWSRILSALTLEKPIFEAEFLCGAKPQPMVRQGIFVPLMPDRTAQCPICDEYTPVEIMKGEDGQDIYRLVCCYPFKRINPKRLRLWQVHEEPLIDLFVQQIGIKGTRKDIVPKRIRQLGRRGQQVFLYLNRVMIDDLKTYGPVLSRFPKAIFVVPTDTIRERLEITTANRCISIYSVTSLDPKYRVVFDKESIEAMIEPENTEKPKTAPRRGNRSANIEKLVVEMKEHYRRAKDHYFSSDGVILPRPTQGELAKLVGIRQDSVSRCLNDPDAVLLRTLWKNAEDIRAILNC